MSDPTLREHEAAAGPTVVAEARKAAGLDTEPTTSWKATFDDLPGYYRGETGVRVDDGKVIDRVERWNVSGSGGQSYTVALALPPEVARAKAQALLAAADQVDPDGGEATVRAITHAWMAHLGYTPEQIAEGEADRDHSQCDFTADGWFCLDENERDRHPIHREMDTAAEMVLFVVEHYNQGEDARGGTS